MMSGGVGTASEVLRAEGSARLDIRSLGAFSLRIGQRTIELTGRKARALVGYLALADGHRETRERLVGLLWSEADETRARASLRQTVYEVREAFQEAGFEGVVADRLVVSLADVVVNADLINVLDEAKAGRAHALLLENERPLDNLFAEIEAIDPAFNVWLLAKRQTYADRITAGLQNALRRDSGDVERVAHALLNLDPTNEEAARALIGARVAVRDTGGALGVYKTLWDLLERDYDTEPSKETQELIAEIKLGTSGSSAPRAASRPAPLATRLIVAIGGFDIAGTSEKHRYLIHGFRQELIASLVRFREWIVRDQAGMEAGASRPGADAGEYVIDASAFESPRGLRLLIMLRDARTNDYLWSERIELSIENWFDAQQTVVQRLATALNVNVSAGQIRAFTGEGPADLRAYDMWLRSQVLMNTFSVASWHQARELMIEVTRRAPTFAPAFSSLAQLNNSAHIAIPGVYLDRSANEEALGYARQAARLDPMDSRGQLCLGWAHILAGHFEQGSLHHKLALDLNESDPWTLISTALGAAFQGHHFDAKERSERALSHTLEPRSVYWGYCAQIGFLRADYADAAKFAERGDSVHILAWQSASLQLSGDRSAARRGLESFFSLAAEQWQGSEKPSREAIARWFLHCFPVRDPLDWQRLRDALAGAGAPCRDTDYGICCSAPHH